MPKNDKRVTILVDESIKNRLVKAATDEDKTVSQVIRGLIKSHFQLIDIQSGQLDTPTCPGACSTNFRHHQ